MNRASTPRPAPLIYAKNVPLWHVLRDLLLTVAAWLAIAQSMRNGFYLLYDYLSPPVFVLTHARVPNLFEMWNALRSFFFVAALLVVWLIFWALYGTKRSRTKQMPPQPRAVSLSEQAKYLGIRDEELVRRRAFRISVIAFNAENQIVDVSSQGIESAIGTAS